MSIFFLAIHYFACYMYFTRTFLDYMPLARYMFTQPQISNQRKDALVNESPDP